MAEFAGDIFNLICRVAKTKLRREVYGKGSKEKREK
jgi:hypothetical protein